MEKGIFVAACALLSFVAAESHAAACRPIHWKPDLVIEVKSAMNLGTRVELPADNVTKPVGSSNLWDVEGAANQVVIKPNSAQPEGKTAVIRAWTEDGYSYDIIASRVPQASIGDVCVKVVQDGKFFTDGARQALDQRSASLRQGSMAAVQLQSQQRLQSQIRELQAKAEEDKKKAVVEALRRFRYHVYTRYSWNQGEGFAAKGVISDVYDDGRFTYIRLFQPNRGLLSVETEVGEKTAIVPTQYDDAYGMYVISGIYPSFTLRVDDAEINISRSDSQTNGQF